MMPIIFGDKKSVPCRQYLELIENCDFEKGSTVYLTVKESIVEKNKTHRRKGIHTDATKIGSWGGPWGGKRGIYLTSNDGLCRLWNEETYNVDNHGSLLEKPKSKEIKCESNILYWISDRTPHESLPANSSHYRQWFRLVGPDIFGWFEEHSTKNPFGVKPQAKIIKTNKFNEVKQYA